MPEQTLDRILGYAEAGAVAIDVPDGPRLTYADLREQVDTAADALAQLGLGRGDRIALVLPNSAETIVLFLAAARVGTAAPLNPAYKEDEFRFYLDDIQARVVVVPPGGAEAARKAVPPGAALVEARVDESGKVTVESDERHDEPAQAGPAAPEKPPLLGAQHRPDLRADGVGRGDVRDAAVPHPWADGLDHGDFCLRWHRDRAAEVRRHDVLASPGGRAGNLVLGGAHDPPDAADAKPRRAAARGRTIAFHPLQLLRAVSPDHAAAGIDLRRAGARGVRHDRSLAPDGVEPAAARRPPAGQRGPRDRHPDRDHGRRHL